MSNKANPITSCAKCGGTNDLYYYYGRTEKVNWNELLGMNTWEGKVLCDSCATEITGGVHGSP